MALTTEQVALWKRVAEIVKSYATNIEVKILQDRIIALADEILANREAQPVGYIDPGSLKEYRGQRAGGTWSAVQRTTSGLNMTTPIYTAPTAPAVPEEIRHTIEGLLSAEIAKYPNSISVPDDLVSLAAYVAGATK